MKSAIIYEGPSLLTGDPVLVAVTGLDGSSQNPKTGKMAQTWILRSDISPSEAVATRRDDSICGDCQHRGDAAGKGRTCYVQYAWAPSVIWKKRQDYPRVSPLEVSCLLKETTVRLGAYGDPAAVPAQVWFDLLAEAKGWTGYTHQWATCDQTLSMITMASVDSEAEYRRAKSMGWRTFRVRSSAGAVLPREVVCPASAEAGHRTTCEKCQLCQGMATPSVRDIVIMAHGSKAKLFSKQELR